MFGRMIKRGAALVSILILLCTGAMRFASADAEQPEGETVTAAGAATEPTASQHLVRTKVVDLGKVPEETKTELRCEVLLVADVETGVLIHEKNINVLMPVGGNAIQLMTAITALDYVELDEIITVTEQQVEAFPRGGKKFGLRVGNNVQVADLVMSMLFNGAMDSAAVLADAAMQRAQADSFSELMELKAQQLGMTSTDYTLSDGTGEEPIMSTAIDQCELYLEAMANEPLWSMLEAGVYETRSTLAESTPTLGSAGKKKSAAAEDKMTRPNPNLPSKLINDVAAVVPENRAYDVRLSAAVSSLVDSTQKFDRYSMVFYRATDYRSDMAILYWAPQSAAAVTTQNLCYLADIFSRRKVIDLIPYIEVAANALTVEKSGLKVSGWFLGDGHVMYGRQMASYDPEAKAEKNAAAQANDFDIAEMKVILKPDNGTMITNGDGSRSIQAKVLVNNSVEGTVTIETAAKAVQTEVSQNTNTVYTDDDITPPEPTLMSQYGWVIITMGVLILGLLVIVIGMVARNRMER